MGLASLVKNNGQVEVIIHSSSDGLSLEIGMAWATLGRARRWGLSEFWARSGPSVRGWTTVETLG